MTKPQLCTNHAEVEAAYRCSQCQHLLCFSCVKQERHLFFCQDCGSHALLLETPAKSLDLKEAASQVFREIKGLSLPIINHMILPAAIILMVSAFLFFLLDVRSVFFSESLAIRRVAFCFGAATVLIARYGRAYGAKGRQLMYTVLLAFATGLVMVRYSHGIPDLLTNVLVVAAVWWLATRITDCLDLGDEEEPKKKVVFGVERLHREQIDRKILVQRPPQGPIISKSLEPGRDRNAKRKMLEGPAAVVARLAAIALVAFALGEPVLLSGPPEVGKRAIITVIVFLFASGIVMSAGSALTVSRRIRLAGGSFSPGVVSGKMAIAFLILVVILSAALAVPGIEYKGSGELSPEISRGNTEGQDKELSEEQRTSQRSGQKSSTDPGLVFRFAASLGQWLLIPLILLLVGLFVYIMLTIRPQKNILLSLKEMFRRLWAKLRSATGSHAREKESSDKPTRKDIVNKLTGLESLPPHQIILKAYEVLNLFFGHLGHHRPSNNTPYEIIRSLPRRYEFLKVHASRLTDLYVNTAYSSSSVSVQEAQSAAHEIRKINSLIEEYQKK